MLKGILLIIGEDREETFFLPRRQLAGLEMENSKKVLTGVSGHGGISVSRASLVCWNVKLYSEYAVPTRANQDRLR